MMLVRRVKGGFMFCGSWYEFWGRIKRITSVGGMGTCFRVEDWIT